MARVQFATTAVPCGVRGLAAMVNAITRLCLIPPIVVVDVTETSITFRSSQFTREANARILEALRDALSESCTVAEENRGTPLALIRIS